jgi:hypothetical protein
VLADAFELYTNAYEKSILLRDFYGKEIILFSDSSKMSRETALKGLQGVLEGTTEEQKKRALKSLKENITTMYVSPHLIYFLSILNYPLVSTILTKERLPTLSFIVPYGNICRGYMVWVKKRLKSQGERCLKRECRGIIITSTYSRSLTVVKMSLQRWFIPRMAVVLSVNSSHRAPPRLFIFSSNFSSISHVSLHF